MKLSKQFWFVIAAIIVGGIAMIISMKIASQPKVINGFTEGTDQHNGYRFAEANKLKSASECHQANTNFPGEKPVSKEFMEGCEVSSKNKSGQ